jgi:hypothetical protein
LWTDGHEPLADVETTDYVAPEDGKAMEVGHIVLEEGLAYQLAILPVRGRRRKEMFGFEFFQLRSATGPSRMRAWLFHKRLCFVTTKPYVRLKIVAIENTGGNMVTTSTIALKANSFWKNFILSSIGSLAIRAKLHPSSTRRRASCSTCTSLYQTSA